jgi:hypothetical protein
MNKMLKLDITFARAFARIPIRSLMPLAFLSIGNATAQNVISGNTESIPSNTPVCTRLEFTNVSTGQQLILESDSSTGNYATTLATGTWQRKALADSHYVFTDTLEIVSNTLGDIDMIKHSPTTSTRPEWRGKILNVFKWLTATRGQPLDPQPTAERYVLNPVRLFLRRHDPVDSSSMPTAWNSTMNRVKSTIEAATNHKAQYREENSDSLGGLSWHYLPNTGPVQGKLGWTDTYVISGQEIAVADCYLNTLHIQEADTAGVFRTGLKEWLRGNNLGARTPPEPNYILAGGDYNGTIHPDEGKTLEILSSFRKSATNMWAYSDSVYTGPISSVSDNCNQAAEFRLMQNYPNPLNPSTIISFSLARSTNVTLRVYNILGQAIATIVSENLNPGIYSRQWNASNVGSGVYYCRLQAGEFVQTKKLIVLR